MVNLPNWIADLLESADIKAAAKDLSKKNDGEETIGTIENENTQALWAAYHKLGEQGRLKIEKYKIDSEKPEHTRGESEEFSREMSLLKSKLDALSELFWASVRVELDIPEGNIGVRRNWEIVKTRESGIKLMGFEIISAG